MKLVRPDSRGARCGICYWALYDGEFCQNKNCINHGKSVTGDLRSGTFVYLTNREAKLLIEANAGMDELLAYKTMCRAAAQEILDHWDAHCNEEGYGPSNLVARLQGKLEPDIYPRYLDEHQ